MNPYDYLFTILLLMYITSIVYNFYLIYFKATNLTMEQSESLIPKYVKLVEYRKKKALEKSKVI